MPPRISTTAADRTALTLACTAALALAPALTFAAEPALPQGTTSGRLAPELRLEGEPAGDACTFVARSKTATFESATGAALDLPAGDYALRVECKTAGGTLVPATPSITITAGKTAAPKLDVRAARLRVEARRSTIMLPGKVHLYAAGTYAAASAADAKPLVELPANQKVAVAQGKYDVFVQLDDPRSPRAEVLLANTSVGGSNVTALEADLSDGGLVAQATMNGKKTAATVRVFPPGSLKDVGLVEAGEELRLPAGRYTVATELRDTADFTTKKRELWIRAGQVQSFTEAFESGELAVSVVRDGKPVDATVLLSLPGATDFFNHFAAPGTVTLSPGAYDVSLSSPALGPLKAPAKPGTKITRGQRAKLVFDLTPATLLVKVTKADKPADAEVHVRAAGGGDDAGAPDNTGAYRLWPGRYEILARLPEGDEVLDGPFEVKLGEKVERKLAFLRAQLTVITTRGRGADADAEILVFRPGATKPTARGRSGAKLELPPGVYDVKITAGDEVVWKEGVRVKTQQTVHAELRAHGTDEALPEGEAGGPSGDLPEGEEASPDGGARDAAR